MKINPYIFWLLIILVWAQIFATYLHTATMNEKIELLESISSKKDQINEHNKRVNTQLLKQNEQLNHRRK